MDDPKTRYSSPAIDQEALAQAVAAGVAAAMGPIIQALQAGQVTQATELAKAARSRRPESYNGDFDYHGISFFKPDGGPLTPLRCPSYLGYWDDEEQKVIPAYPYLADEFGGCTEEERRLLNQLEPGVFKAQRRDGVTGPVRVELRRDVDGAPMRLVICVPKQWLSKELKNQIGGVELLRQLQPALAGMSA